MIFRFLFSLLPVKVGGFSKEISLTYHIIRSKFSFLLHSKIVHEDKMVVFLMFLVE